MFADFVFFLSTNVTDVGGPYGRSTGVPETCHALTRLIIGGYPKFIAEGWNDKYLPVWLQEAGYSTYYTGKLMNGHSTSTYNKPYPRGWNGTNCESRETATAKHNTDLK